MQEIKSMSIWKKMMIKLSAFGMHLKGHGGQICYYACIALVLTAVALAAERWRTGSEEQEALILPAVEITQATDRIPESVFEKTDDMRLLRIFTVQPEWNRMHGQWECHTAVDYACEHGQVYSLSEGIVQTVGRSGIYGGFVEIETEDYLLRYASVDPAEDLQPGDRVKKGDSLGSADESMPGESYLGAHLHLELMQDGVKQDFEQVINKNIPTLD